MTLFSITESVALVMVVTFLSYVIAIIVPFLRRTSGPVGDATRYDWHIFIPSRDEEAVIRDTLERLRSTFPFCHAWVIDDDSDDRTGDIVSEIAEHDHRVHVVRRTRPNARTGKGAALNAAYDALNAYLPDDVDRTKVIVCVLDADGQLATDAFDRVAGPEAFGDPRVGAAQIAVWMANRDDPRPRPDRGWWWNRFSRFLVRMQDMEFRTTIAAMQMLRVRVGTVGLGGNGQFSRLSVLDQIARDFDRPWHGSLLEDYELGLHVLFAGYENRYVHQTHVAQEAVVRFKRLVAQRTRWAQGNMQCIRYIPAILRSRHFGNAGVVESCYYLFLPFMQLLGTIIWPIILGITVYETTWSSGGIGDHVLASWWLVLLFVTLAIGPFAIWGPIYRKQCAPEAPRWKSLAWGLGMWVHVFYMYLYVVRAFVRILLGRTGWAKTRRNAEATVTGPIARDT